MGKVKARCGFARRTRNETKCVIRGSKEPNAKLSLPVVSNEKLCCLDDDCIVRDRSLQNGEVGEQSFECPIPSVKISCEALNYERIIDFVNNNVTPGKRHKLKTEPRKKTGRSVKRKTDTIKKSLNVIRVAVQKGTKKPVQKKEKTPENISVKEAVEEISKSIGSDRKPKTMNISVKNSKLLPKKISLRKDKKILNMGNESSPQICEEKSVLHSSDWTIHQTNNKRISLSPNDQSSINLNTEVLSSQDISRSLFYFMNDEAAFAEFQDIHLETFESNVGDIKMKLDSASGNNLNVEEATDTNVKKKILSDSSKEKNPSELDNGEVGLDKISLQTAVETFMRNPQVKYLKGSTSLKRGLCFSWLSNNYVCTNQQCLYNHNALNLFTKKLKRYPSKFVMSVVVSMKQDLLFVDVVLAAFRVISERQIPIVWVTFLTFFVFYVTEPSDSRFLKFWATAARFFCDLQKTSSATSGFASLLSIFSNIDDSEKWKIIEFIKVIQQPPVQICMNFTLLQPVLKMELPVEFLTAAVESCIATQKDVLKVYCLIVPKIPTMTSPIQIVELLLRFSKTLEEMKRKDLADDLKLRLRGKVWSIQSKITHHKYPLAASFQEELSVYSNEGSYLVPSADLPEEASEMDLPFLGDENIYFQPEEDFCSLMAQALELSTDTIPKSFRCTDDVGERQIIRIKQFFRDYQFDILGKYLNELDPSMIDRAAEEFLKLLFSMKISVKQGVDLLKIIVLTCKSHISAKVIASISVTLTLNLVRINEWEKAYTIVSLCQEKQINLVEGKVYYTSEFNAVTQCRIALLLIEIYAYKGDYGNAVDLVKKYSLFSPNNSLWQLSSIPQDEIIRVRILEDLLGQIIFKQLTQQAYDLFEMIWKDQKQLLTPVELKKFVNDIVILLLNKGNEEALNLYEQIKTDDVLNDISVRAVLVTLVRRKRLSDAKSLLLSSGQNCYAIPKITQGSTTVKVLSYWLEEEIYVMFDALFDLLATDKTCVTPQDYKNVEINLEESRPNLPPKALRPLCLGIITPSAKNACNRIQRVLQQQFNPPLKLVIMPYYLKLDELSVKLQLQKRMKN